MFVCCCVPLVSKSIVVLVQPGWYTLSVVGRISGTVQVGTMSCIVGRVSDQPTLLQLGTMSRIEEHTRHTAGGPNMEEGITVWGDEYGTVDGCRDISSSSSSSSSPGYGWDLNRSNGDCWDLNWIKM